MALDRLKTFVFIAARSLSSPNYYRQVIMADPKLSVKYYLSLMLLLTLFTTTVITLQSTPLAKKYSILLLNELYALYPEDLELSINNGGNGTFVINKPEPHIIPLPAIARDTAPATLENLIVFDSQGTIEDLRNYRTLILMNEVNLLVQTPADQDVYPLNSFPETLITKTSVGYTIEQLKVIVHYLGAFIFLILATFLLFYNFFVRMLYLILAAVSLFLISRIRGIELPFSRLYQIVLHAATWPVLLEMVMVVGLKSLLPSFWFFMTILILGNIVLLVIEK